MTKTQINLLNQATAIKHDLGKQIIAAAIKAPQTDERARKLVADYLEAQRAVDDAKHCMSKF